MQHIQQAASLVRRHAAGVFLGLLLNGPALAQDGHGSPALELPVDPGVLVQGLITERDIVLVFRHLRESVLGNPDGGGAGGGEELAQRTEEIRREIQLRGAALGVAILDLLERRTKDALRETPFASHLRASPAPTYERAD